MPGASGPENPAGPPRDGPWPYLGVGCLTAVIGLVGGGMLGAMVATIVGVLSHCARTNEGAPCNWDTYWTWGARIGVILLPTLALWRLWRGRHRPQNTTGDTGGSR